LRRRLPVLLSCRAGQSRRFQGWGTSGRHLRCIDCHAAGEPARVVIGGLPHVPGNSMKEKRARMMQPNMDSIRKLLLLEPRGYPCQNANYVLPPSGQYPTAVFGIVIAEQGFIYPAMSGHNMMCVSTALLETGMVPMVEPITTFDLETPAGLVSVTATCAGGKALEIKLRNVPSFCRVEDMDVEVDVPGGVGRVCLDIAYGGMHYAIVDAAQVGLELIPQNGREICRLGEMIKVACREQHPVNHPEFDYPGCDIIAFTADRRRVGNRVFGKNAVVMSNGKLDWERPDTWTGMIDRSPCGTGTSAVMAQLFARGELAIGEEFVHESIIGTVFTGKLEEEASISHKDGTLAAVIPSISGSAWITQYSEVVCHPTDPFPEGYTVGDIWSADS
ncbi:unnamed protein product, partial [Polarella glacialis]